MDKIQHPIYYISKSLVGAESWYPSIEKLAYCLLLVVRKLRPYFQAHPITVLTDQPLRKVLQKPEASNRLLKWVVELGQYHITYQPRTAIKGQALEYFIVECTIIQKEDEQAKKPEDNEENWPVWRLFVDGSSNEHNSGVGLILITPEGHRIHCTLRFDFSASNNEAEYEALLVGLRLTRDVKVVTVDIYSDSKLVVNQVLGEYQARGLKMTSYHNKVKDLLT